MTQDELKQAVAIAALDYVVEGRLVGVGTGSTARCFIEALASIKHRITGAVASSEDTRRRLEGHGIKVLSNSSACVETAKGPIQVAGLEDHSSGTPDAVRALSGIDGERPVIVLAHDPASFADVPDGPAVTICGHTHGGQMGLFGHTLMPPLFRYWRGLYEQAGHYCYVHKGSGGRFPYRLGCMPEIAYFTLRRK